MRAREILRKKSMLIFRLSAPSSSSRAAARRVAAFVLAYWKQPVSVVTAIYRRFASCSVTLPVSSSITSSTASPQADFSACRSVAPAYSAFDGWWSMHRSTAPEKPCGNRSGVAISTATTHAGTKSAGAKNCATYGR